jgi:hypothetical protein
LVSLLLTYRTRQQPNLISSEIYTTLHPATSANITTPTTTKIDNALLGSSISTKTTTVTATSDSEAINPLLAQTQHLLRLSRALLACHRTADQKAARAAEQAQILALTPSSSLSSSSSSKEKLKERKRDGEGKEEGGKGSEQKEEEPRATWERDAEAMRALLACGRAYGVRVVEGWIAPSASTTSVLDHGEEGRGSDGADDDRGEGGVGVEAKSLARGLFNYERGNGMSPRLVGSGKRAEEEESWGMMARKQMVALMKVVRTLPAQH